MRQSADVLCEAKSNVEVSFVLGDALEHYLVLRMILMLES